MFRANFLVRCLTHLLWLALVIIRPRSLSATLLLARTACHRGTRERLRTSNRTIHFTTSRSRYHPKAARTSRTRLHAISNLATTRTTDHRTGLSTHAKQHQGKGISQGKTHATAHRAGPDRRSVPTIRAQQRSAHDRIDAANASHELRGARQSTRRHTV